MVSGLLYDPSSGIGTAGRARARRDQVLGMTPRVIEDTGDRLVVQRWFSDEVSVWVRIGLPKEGLYELQPSVDYR
jgi:hypothetical protein